MATILLDPLYGEQEISSFLNTLIRQPEVQRLREIRLSNINSMLLPGSSNISRFEHVVGTAILAQILAQKIDLPKRDGHLLVCAALLHDLGITPFGHLMEEGFLYAGRPYDHEQHLEQIFVGGKELGGEIFQIYRGREVGFRKILDSAQFRALGLTPTDVFALKQGKGSLGWLINGTLDLDNLDNVLRMSYHLGLQFDRQLPFEILDGFRLVRDQIYFLAHRLDAIQEWSRIRRQLYNILMTNRADFAAKTMLIEAIVLGLQGKSGFLPVLDETSWKLTDAELWARLQAFQPTAQIIDRLALGDFYQVVALYWIRSPMLRRALSRDGFDLHLLHTLEDIGCSTFDLPISVYAIPDKRTRSLHNYRLISSTGVILQPQLEFAASSDLTLLGFCTPRRGRISPQQLQALREAVKECLNLSGQDISDCDASGSQFDGSSQPPVLPYGEPDLFPQ